MSVCADVLQRPPETHGPGPCPAVWFDRVNGDLSLMSSRFGSKQQFQCQHVLDVTLLLNISNVCVKYDSRHQRVGAINMFNQFFRNNKVA